MADPAPANTPDPTVGTPATIDVAASLNSLMPGQQKVPPKVPDTPPPPAEGPVIVMPNPPTDTTPPPGDNGAPPARPPNIPPPNNSISFQDVFINILFVVLCVIGGYYGWAMGQEYARSYLLYVQSYGPWIRSWFTSRQIPTK